MREAWAAQDTPTSRYCPVCDTNKPWEDFSASKARVRRTCKACERAQHRRRMQRYRRKGGPGVQLVTGPEVIVQHLPPVTTDELTLQRQAACAGLPWFDLPEEMCKETCDVCPALPLCRAHCDRVERSAAGAHGYTRGTWLDGVWAGETPLERAQRRSGRRLFPTA